MGDGLPAGSQGVDVRADTLRSSDPAVLRALAHPVRAEILDLLSRGRRELTASEIAELTDQTVANCSFHLRSLEKVGFVVRAEPRGREKPWRAAARSLDLRPDPADPESVRAAGAVAALYVQREAARVMAALATPDPEPQWNDAVTFTMSSFWATAEEMVELGQAIGRLTDAFSGRDADPSRRPAGARRGRLFATVNPEGTESGAAAGA